VAYSRADIAHWNTIARAFLHASLEFSNKSNPLEIHSARSYFELPITMRRRQPLRLPSLSPAISQIRYHFTVVADVSRGSRLSSRSGLPLRVVTRVHFAKRETKEEDERYIKTELNK